MEIQEAQISQNNFGEKEQSWRTSQLLHKATVTPRQYSIGIRTDRQINRIEFRVQK